ncbi:hypothetical protein PV325_000239 [Microctonus aethiopoides]|nr:hypothetical protein PV325_000239 [Microctonus aethiopoides]
MKEFSTSPYTIKVAMSSDLPGVLEVMRHNFHFEETIFNALCSNAHITQEEKNNIEKVLDESVEIAFKSAPCLVAIHNDTNKIIGVNLMTITKNPKLNDKSREHKNFFDSNNTKSKLVNQYFKYLSEFNEKANLFVKYPKSKAILEFYAIAVDKNHRKMGISKNLINAGIILAKNIGNISLVFGVFTSLYSMKSAQKIGMNILLKIDLLDYKNNEDELIFENTKPHNIVYIMDYKLKPKTSSSSSSS